MVSYVGRRLALLLPVLLGTTVIVFVLIHSIPGDPAANLLGPGSTPAQRHELRAVLALDAPLPVQYGKWLWQTARLDLGTSIARQQPVSGLVLDALGNTLILAIATTLFATLVGTVLGVLAATRQFSSLDRIATGIAAVLTAVPSYWFGIVLVGVFAVSLGMLPSGGMRGAFDTNGDPVDLLWHLVLPTLAAGAVPAGIMARTVRASVLEILRLDFVQALRAAGLSELNIVLRHVLPNALPPIINIAGLQLGYLLGGVAFVEVVFSWPGVGNLLFLSITERDYPVIMGIVIVVSFTFVIINLAVDVVHASLDPRVRAAAN